jgi:hypothetical protein
MRSDERNVMEKGAIGVGVGVILQAVNGVIDGRGRDVVIRLVRLGFQWDIVKSIAFRCEEVPLIPRVQRMVESAVEHVAVDMPLSAVVIAIAVRLEEVGQQARPILSDAATARSAAPPESANIGPCCRTA